MYSLPNNHISSSSEPASSTTKTIIKRPARKEKTYPPLAFTNTKFGQRYVQTPLFEEEAATRALPSINDNIHNSIESRVEQPHRGSLSAHHPTERKSKSQDKVVSHPSTSLSLPEYYSKKKLPAIPVSELRNRRADFLVEADKTVTVRPRRNGSVADLEDWFRPLGNPSYLDERPGLDQYCGIFRQAAGEATVLRKAVNDDEDFSAVDARLGSFDIGREIWRRPSSWHGEGRISWMSEDSEESFDLDEEMDELARVLECLREY